jgi:RHS repeat-associated protein
MAWSTSYYHYDALGSTRQLSNSDQVVTDSYVYDAYGNERSATGSTVNPFHYVGELGYYIDEDSATINVRARVYQPSIIRWLSRDPLGFEGSSWNLYLYTNRNPIVATDPSGLWIRLQEEGLWLNEAGETIEELVQLVAPKLNARKNKSCIRPVTDRLPDLAIRLMEAEWKRKRPHACRVYDVRNLTDKLPRGQAIIASVGTDRNNYIRLASHFYGATNMTGAALGDLIRTRSNQGSSPLGELTIVGHSWRGKDLIGGQDGEFFRLRNLRASGSYFAWPSFKNATNGILPPICWFRTDATVRLVGCITRGFADQWASAILRGNATAYGTNRPTWAYSESEMGWGKRTSNALNWELDRDAGTAKSPREYHMMEEFWVPVAAKNLED